MKDARQPSGALTDPEPPPLLREASAPVAVGAVIAGRYELRERLGAGGMGMVFRAHDREIDEDIALKVLLSSRLGEDRALALLRSEVKLARRITHRNVCRVFDLGEDGELKFLTMELVRGRPVRDLLSRGRVEPEQAFAILEQVVAGLGAAHAEGVLHRDLKPENVMICDDGRVALVDFGLARSLEKEAAASGARGGTPAYMSPEQIRGEALDARSDVFSFGILAFEVLSGEGPFGRLATSEIVRAILDSDPRSLVVPGLPGEVTAALEAVLFRAMAKRAEERYSSIGEVGEALAEVRRPPSSEGTPGPEADHTGRRGAEGQATASNGRRLERRVVAGATGLGLILAAVAVFFSMTGSLSRGAGHPALNSGAPMADGGSSDRPDGGPASRPAADDEIALDVSSFENRTGEPRWDALARTATLALQAELQREPGVRVASAYDAAASPGSVWRLEGAVLLSGSQIRVTAQLRAPDGSPAGEPIEAEGSPGEEQEMLSRLRARSVDEVRLLQRARERRLRAARGTSSQAAREALLRYYDLIGPAPRIEVLEAAKSLVADALVADPDYVPALLERADLLTFEGLANTDNAKLSEALSVVERALILEPENPRALLLRCQNIQRDVLNNGYPTDEDLSRASKACDVAASVLPRSAEVLRIKARLSDFTCQDDLAMTQLQRALEMDRSLSAPILGHLIALALQNGKLDLADKMSQRLVKLSDEEERLGLRALSRRAGTPPAEGARGTRAEVLFQLGKLEEAQALFEKELGYISAGLGNTWVEPTAIRGLLRVARHREVPPPAHLTRRLSIIESDYRASTARDPSAAWVLAGAYQFVDPEAALVWIRRLGPPGNYREALVRALFHHLAGDRAGARRALGERRPVHRWEQACLKWVQRALGP